MNQRSTTASATARLPLARTVAARSCQARAGSRQAPVHSTDEAVDALGVAGGQAHAGHPAQREADDVRLAHAEPVEQGDDVVGEVVDGVGAGRDGRAPVAAGVVADDAEVLAPARRPRVPHRRSSTRASWTGRRRVPSVSDRSRRGGPATALIRDPPRRSRRGPGRRRCTSSRGRSAPRGARISWASVARMRAPVAPTGWPSEMPEPLGLSRSSVGSTFHSRRQASTWAANASLSSIRSMSSRVRPGAVEGGGGRRDRSDAHHLGADAGHGPRPQREQRAQAAALGLLARGDDAHRGAVVLAAGVAGGDGGLGVDLPAHRPQRGELLEGGLGAGVLVAVDDDVGLAAAARDR